ncbi:PTS system mannose/fructose/N-acetylgalactosamine-transporter subunit IIB [Enterococcus pallens]|uniref:PTS EIIB type-4 domain-containing protein n=1 Tax=Enterococcus pallens ATCC BAA-351 TaxID=1158607 RepID=R2SK56_9ENTE|nr:PTS sugar transporter subunit IIB [Enterococcus pallens]EOH95560.1 hypothetical protein UAU_01522 [Enterococcus pallens ATCC BAA-351]EOU21303.1 hypothetical protein I588_02150 [Enterococcus pallens ATCC BAA-351]
MSNIKLSRVDNRYIHGQVNARLIKEYNITKVLMISDINAKDPFMSTLYKSVAIGYTVDILGIEDAVEAWNSGVYQTENMMLLWGNIKDAYDTLQAGLKFDFIALANIPGEVGAVQVNASCYISEKEADYLRSMNDEGVEIYFQAMPSLPKTTLEKALQITKL